MPADTPPTPRSAPLDARGRPLRDLRISVTDRCNFRCSYCMPSEIFGDRYQFLPKSEILSFEEIERLARVFVRLGVEKIRVTGGEPLLRADLPQLVGRLSALEGVQEVALTTNATLLPRQAQRLADAGLTRVTVSLDSLDEAVFRRMNGDRLSVAAVLAGIEAAEQAGLTPIKVNCVVQRGVNDRTLVDLARHFRGTGHVLRFIEFMDVGTRNQWDRTHVLPASELVAMLDAALGIEPIDPNYRGEVAERWRYRDGSGEIGFINSVSRPFCGECTRARLTTEGELVTCLFASGGVDLRAPLRAGESDEALYERIRSIWSARSDRYSEERSQLLQVSDDTQSGTGRVEMYRIGG